MLSHMIDLYYLKKVCLIIYWPRCRRSLWSRTFIILKVNSCFVVILLYKIERELILISPIICKGRKYVSTISKRNFLSPCICATFLICVIKSTYETFVCTMKLKRNIYLACFKWDTLYNFRELTIVCLLFIYQTLTTSTCVCWIIPGAAVNSVFLEVNRLLT